MFLGLLRVAVCAQRIHTYAGRLFFLFFFSSCWRRSLARETQGETQQREEEIRRGGRGAHKEEGGIRGPRFEALAGRLSRRGGSTLPEGDLGARTREVGHRGPGVRCRRHSGDEEERKRQRGLSGPLLVARPRRPPRDCFPEAGIACQAPLTHYSSGPASLLLSSPLLYSPRCLVLDRAPPCSLYSYPAARVLSIPDHHTLSSTAMHTACCAARAVRFYTTAATRSNCSRDRAPSICFSPLVALPQIAPACISSYN